MFYNVRSVVGNIDILVNNAGITRDSLFKAHDRARLNEVINTNLNSVFKRHAPGHRRHGWEPRLGRIVNISP